MRLNGARCLLAQSAALADAALAMGFADQSHLQRAFKAHHAATPGCYAKQQLALL
ncbi:helix-turn-helix domain-containing protein [Comamonas jiangduensis]|uniref:helix-turn-helix domain-containing protein n=1 Tax=Comamonas jiangduensis TaxID=1194168 RepID=UPI003BF82BE8